jgi:hypothetical protein
MKLKQREILGRPYPDEQVLVYEEPNAFIVGNLLYEELFAHGNIFTEGGIERFNDRSLTLEELAKRTGIDEYDLKLTMDKLLKQECVQIYNERYVMNPQGAVALGEYIAECSDQGISLPEKREPVDLR